MFHRDGDLSYRYPIRDVTANLLLLFVSAKSAAEILSKATCLEIRVYFSRRGAFRISSSSLQGMLIKVLKEV